MSATVNRLAKWRAIFAAWQLGTRAKGDPEADAVRDHREVTILVRAEVNALTSLLISKGLIDEREFRRHLDVEAEHLMRAFEKRFPGAEATDEGMKLDLRKAAEWMKGFRP